MHSQEPLRFGSKHRTIWTGGMGSKHKERPLRGVRKLFQIWRLRWCVHLCLYFEMYMECHCIRCINGRSKTMGWCLEMRIGVVWRRLVRETDVLQWYINHSCSAEGNPDEEKIGAFGVGEYQPPLFFWHRSGSTYYYRVLQPIFCNGRALRDFWRYNLSYPIPFFCWCTRNQGSGWDFIGKTKRIKCAVLLPKYFIHRLKIL